MDIVDILIHVHPDFSEQQRNNIEQAMRSEQGVVSVHFSADHSHQLTVAYNPKATQSALLLKQVRQWDKDAMMAGL